jgi:hypothetical protein
MRSDCERFERLLVAWKDGSIGQADRDFCDRHVCVCEACADLDRQESLLVNLLRDADMGAPDDELSVRARTTIWRRLTVAKERSLRERSLRYLVASASGALLLAIALEVVSHAGPRVAPDARFRGGEVPLSRVQDQPRFPDIDLTPADNSFVR